jgi:excisionase family DNA binding protein
MTDKPRNVMGIDGLSKYLDVSKSTLYKLAQEGKLPGQKVGKHWRFRKETVDRWLDEGSDKPEAEKNG